MYELDIQGPDNKIEFCISPDSVVAACFSKGEKVKGKSMWGAITEIVTLVPLEKT